MRALTIFLQGVEVEGLQRNLWGVGIALEGSPELHQQLLSEVAEPPEVEVLQVGQGLAGVRGWRAILEQRESPCRDARLERHEGVCAFPRFDHARGAGKSSRA